MTVMPVIKYRPDIDGLRAIAVLAVVFHHLSPELAPGGFVGVDVFFVISGFLITTIIGAEISEGRFTFGKFYERRARRLFPALFAMLAVTLLASWFLLLPSDLIVAAKASIGTLLFSSNVLFWKSLAEGYFAADSKLNPLLHTWSLGVEEQFYLFFPILLIAIQRFLRGWLRSTLLGIAIISFVAGAWLLRSHQVAVFFLSPFRAWELLVGALLATCEPRAVVSGWIRQLLAVGGLGAILGSVFALDSHTAFPGWAAVPPVLGAGALIYSGAREPTEIARLLSVRPLVFTGLISYSLYLWHWPLIVLARFATDMRPVESMAVPLFAASFLLASMSYVWVERPFRMRARASGSRSASAALWSASLIGVFSVLAITQMGYPSRFEGATVRYDQQRHPVVPFRACDGKVAWCRFGPTGKEPTVLFWGDSHLLALGPALEAQARARQEAAIFAIHSACLPLFGGASSWDPGCGLNNRRIHRLLEHGSSIRTVVLAAYWSEYFDPASILYSPLEQVSGASATGPAVSGTVGWLLQKGYSVLVVSDVPTYDGSVPLMLAIRSRGLDRDFEKSLTRHRSEQARFLATLPAEGGGFSIVDPAEWLCRPLCSTSSRGLSLYRDSGHLSVRGAMLLSAPLGRAIWERRPAPRSRPKSDALNMAAAAK